MMAILDVVANEPEPTSPARVAETVDLSLSTVARLMRDMAAEGLLERSARDGSYSLGARLQQLVKAGAQNTDPMMAVRPVLAEVRDTTGETTSLHVRNQGQRVCVAEVQSRHDVRRVIPLGLALPLNGTATGEVLMAGAPPQERESEIEALGLSPRDRRILEKRLDKITERGWAMVSDEWQEGVTGLSAAVRDQGVTIAALSVSGPTSRFSPEWALEQVEFVVDAAERIAAHLAPHQ